MFQRRSGSSVVNPNVDLEALRQRREAVPYREHGREQLLDEDVALSEVLGPLVPVLAVLEAELGEDQIAPHVIAAVGHDANAMGLDGLHGTAVGCVGFHKVSMECHHGDLILGEFESAIVPGALGSHAMLCEPAQNLNDWSHGTQRAQGN